MSAFYAVAFADRIELLTDGAVYEDDGTLMDIKRKVWTSDHAPLAVTGRGDSGAVERVATGIILAASLGMGFDATIESLNGAIERTKGETVPGDCEMVITGISETNGPVIYYFSTVGVYGNEPWTLYRMGAELCGGIPVDTTGLDASDGLRGLGVELFERMRRCTGPNPAKPDLAPIHGIGGHVDFTVVTAEGCTVERLHTWPDVIGEKIRPEGERRYGLPESTREEIAAFFESGAIVAASPDYERFVEDGVMKTRPTAAGAWRYMNSEGNVIAWRRIRLGAGHSGFDCDGCGRPDIAA